MKLKEYYQNPKVTIIEETHQYIDVDKNQVIEAPSATRLIEYFYPFNANEIDPTILEAAIDKGVCVHGLISQFLKEVEIDECCHAKDGKAVRTHLSEYNWIKNKLKYIKAKEIYSEVSISNYKMNGTFDLLYLDENNKWHLVDFKTTSRLNRLKETLQLKLYELLILELFEDVDQIDYFEVYNSRNEAHYTITQEELYFAQNQIEELKSSEEFSNCF
ncbi:PD-(D/E)XK nuclease family protein [Spiroplasma alleghenense]|uniref:PD-(D/E)XK endonuclease-like domain-containing protein n=1 Tax=Spiroplasma alleghenense TaxID=216931 RepID=A0A345Z593_9MOLU|nr:PD-(D/E)XK nuclease family protein [Spiroplasma alleghenense]AXK51772.1 hypothetical protein SALLE_v1c11020 [Spiroplasma alleghenense]